jgi:hypothetical protein
LRLFLIPAFPAFPALLGRMHGLHEVR